MYEHLKLEFCTKTNDSIKIIVKLYKKKKLPKRFLKDFHYYCLSEVYDLNYILDFNIKDVVLDKIKILL